MRLNIVIKLFLIYLIYFYYWIDNKDILWYNIVIKKLAERRKIVEVSI